MRYQGTTTKTKLNRSVLARYFAFIFITQFVIFTLIGVAYQLVATAVVEIGKKDIDSLLKELSDIPDKINDTYLSQSNYWCV
jgi:hypothetical protein